MAASEVENLRAEVERLGRDLEIASSEKIQSAQYGLVLLEEKAHLQQKCEELETLYENTKHDLDITLEVRLKRKWGAPEVLGIFLCFKEIPGPNHMNFLFQELMGYPSTIFCKKIVVLCGENVKSFPHCWPLFCFPTLPIKKCLSILIGNKQTESTLLVYVCRLICKNI